MAEVIYLTVNRLPGGQKNELPKTSREFWRKLEGATWLTLRELREYLEKHQHSPAVRRTKDPDSSAKLKYIAESFFKLSVEIRMLGEESIGQQGLE